MTSAIRWSWRVPTGPPKGPVAIRPAAGLIHHSDRGVQYCSHMYVNELKRKGIKISMTEEKHCYENAIAERVNGILKDEFYLDQCFFSTGMQNVQQKMQ